MTPNPNVVSTAHALFFGENRREDALRFLESEAARFPDSLEIMDYLAFLYASDGRYLDALRLFTQIADAAPTPRCMSNIVFCRIAAATSMLDGQPINGAASGPSPG